MGRDETELGWQLPLLSCHLGLEGCHGDPEPLTRVDCGSHLRLPLAGGPAADPGRTWQVSLRTHQITLGFSCRQGWRL